LLPFPRRQSKEEYRWLDFRPYLCP
jgi:hypothetical protein